MPTEELVSVIVPVYNIEDYLPQCLACLEMQTYRNLEIILVDDGSTDRTGQICDEYAAKDSRARVIHHPQNIGLWAARNTGQDAAHGEYLWFPDGDDYFHKDIVRIMHNIIKKTSSLGKEYDMVIVNYRQTTRHDENVVAYVVPSYTEKTAAELLDNMDHPNAKHYSNPMWNKFFRNKLISVMRSRQYKYAQDRDFCIRVFLKEPAVAFIENELYWWLQRPSSAMHRPDYPVIHAQCATTLYYNNLVDLKGDSNKYSRYLLFSLYYWLAKWVDFSRGSDYEPFIRRQTRTIIRKTGLSYLKCDFIKTPKKRLFMLLKLRFNRLYEEYLRIVRQNR